MLIIQCLYGTNIKLQKIHLIRQLDIFESIQSALYQPTYLFIEKSIQTYLLPQLYLYYRHTTDLVNT